MKSINLRLEDELHGRVKAQADRDHRSLNQELIWLLERGLMLDDLRDVMPGNMPREQEGQR